MVATFIPVVNRATKNLKRPPSKYLMPLSFLAIFGGSCTLIRTSTNLLVSGMATDRGFEGFNMFTLAPVGLCLFAAGILYILFHNYPKEWRKDRYAVRQKNKDKLIFSFLRNKSPRL